MTTKTIVNPDGSVDIVELTEEELSEFEMMKVNAQAFAAEQPKRDAQAKLNSLDTLLPRSVEDVYDAIGWDKAHAINVTRKSEKDALRAIIRG